MSKVRSIPSFAVHLTFSIIFFATAVFYLARWKVDPLALGAGACLFYFSPGLLGALAIPQNDAGLLQVQLASTTYIVMSSVTLAVVGGTIFADRVLRDVAPIRADFQYLPHGLFVITSIAAVIAIYKTGASFFCEKQLLFQRVDGFYFVSLYGGVLCMGASLASRRWCFVFFSFVLVAAILFVGFRDAATMSVLAAMLLLAPRALSNVRSAFVFALFLLVCAVSLLMFKEVSWNWKQAFVDLCPISTPAAPSRLANSPFSALPFPDSTERLGNAPLAKRLENAPNDDINWNALARARALLFVPNAWMSAIAQNEATVIQVGLNGVITSRFGIPWSVLGRQLAAVFPFVGPLFPSLMWRNTPTFNSLFQPALFPNIQYGMAGSVWAEGYAAGGLGCVILFSLVYSAVLVFLSWLMLKTRGPVQGVVAVFAAWWGFYFHRNDLMIEIDLIKMSLCVLGGAAVLSMIFSRIWVQLGPAFPVPNRPAQHD